MQSKSFFLHFFRLKNATTTDFRSTMRLNKASTYDFEELGPGPEVIKLFSCSTQLSIKFSLVINVKMPTVVGILTFMSRKNSILSFSESEKC